MYCCSGITSQFLDWYYRTLCLLAHFLNSSLCPDRRQTGCLTLTVPAPPHITWIMMETNCRERKGIQWTMWEQPDELVDLLSHTDTTQSSRTDTQNRHKTWPVTQKQKRHQVMKILFKINNRYCQAQCCPRGGRQKHSHIQAACGQMP